MVHVLIKTSVRAKIIIKSTSTYFDMCQLMIFSLSLDTRNHRPSRLPRGRACSSAKKSAERIRWRCVEPVLNSENAHTIILIWVPFWTQTRGAHQQFRHYSNSSQRKPYYIRTERKVPSSSTPINQILTDTRLTSSKLLTAKPCVFITGFTCAANARISCLASSSSASRTEMKFI